MIIRPNKAAPEWLFVPISRHSLDISRFISSPALYTWITRWHVYKDDLSKYVRIPIPPKDWLAEFEDLSLECEKARNEGKAKMVNSFALVQSFVERLLG